MRRSMLVWCVLLCWAVGCASGPNKQQESNAGENTQTQERVADAGGGNDAVSSDGKGGSEGGGTEERDRDAGGGSEGGVRETGSPETPAEAKPVCKTDPATIPKASPSSRKVTFVVENKTNASFYVTEQGLGCTAYELAGIRLATGFSCPCECPRPQEPHVSVYKEVKPGATYTFTWNAHKLALYSVKVDCAERGWPGAGCQSEQRSVVQAVGGGQYKLRLGVARNKPSRCQDDGQGALNCTVPFDPQGPPETGGYGRLCKTTDYIEVNFTLPDTGDFKVDVPTADKDIQPTAP